jgi:hypothetical protein
MFVKAANIYHRVTEYAETHRDEDVSTKKRGGEDHEEEGRG